MIKLHKKRIKGHTYWYLVSQRRIKGKLKDEWQIYLGTPKKILEKIQKVGPSQDTKIKSYGFGKIALLLAIDEVLGFSKTVNQLTKKKKIQGLTVGEYLLLTLFGRWCGPLSKKATAEHFEKTFLKFYYNIPHKMNSQNILNHMKYIKDKETIDAISDEISKHLIALGIAPTILNLDTTNFSTNIVNGGKLLQKGPAKNKRFDQNLVGLALITDDANIPFFHETYPGNRHDSKIFPELVDKIVERLKTLKIDPESITIVMDKGNNSDDNISKITDPKKGKMHVVGSLKKVQVLSLMKIPLDRFEFLYTNKKEHKILGYRQNNFVAFGQTFTVVISYNPATEKRQRLSYEKAKQKFLKGMADLKQRYERTKGKGRKMGQTGAIKEISKILPDKYLSVFKYEVEVKPKVLKYWIDEDKEKEGYYAFGKNAIFTDIDNWSSKQIVKTYNAKYKLENDFHWLKDKLLIPITPIYVWTDDSIRVHVFLCVTGLLFMNYFIWKMKDLKKSNIDLLDALEGIRVALVARDGDMNNVDLVIEEMDRIQSRIFSRFDMGRYLQSN